MYQLSSQEFWAHFFKDFRCGNCGSDAGYESRPRNFLEQCVVPLLLLKMVRCGDCYHRSFRPLNVTVRSRRESPHVDHAQAVSSLLETGRKEPEKQMPKPANDRQRIA
jgi:hypothetical protein